MATTKRKLHVGHSPLSNHIFAGYVLKDGRTWASGKEDVTNEALCAVAEQVLRNGNSVIINADDKPIFEIIVKKL